MRQLWQQMKWQFLILHRNNLINISIAITAFYAIGFWLLRSLGNMELVLLVLIYNDPAIIGMFFFGLAVIMEKNQAVFSALMVTPQSLHTYLLARILSLSIVGTLCALGMAFAVLGTAFWIWHFVAGVWGTCLLFSLAGVYLVSFTSDFLQFLLRSIPLLLVLSLPLFNYLQLTAVDFFYLMPIQGALNLITHSYSGKLPVWELVYGYGSLIFWGGLLYLLVYRVFKRKVWWNNA